MHIVLFSHPSFFGDQKVPTYTSMPRYTNILSHGLRERGHDIEIWSPQPQFFKFPIKGIVKKWFGYIDQYVVFPYEVRRRLKQCSSDTLFVFTDHAQGPWVPLVADRHHVIHCHDFLAQDSALGKIAENQTGWTGRQYQRLIYLGYSKGKNFISVSKKTEQELHRFLPVPPAFSTVVYNGLNKSFELLESNTARQLLSQRIHLDLTSGYILHVGGDHWYKNRSGVIEIYNSWRLSCRLKLPLLLIGDRSSDSVSKTFMQSPFKDDIHIISGLEDEYVRFAYAGASVFLFPSLAEGFGWPIAEAMACGCPVITTDEAPMTEVAGNAGFYVKRRPNKDIEATLWAKESAKVVENVLNLSSSERKCAIDAGLENVKKFDIKLMLDTIESIYSEIFKNGSASNVPIQPN